MRSSELFKLVVFASGTGTNFQAVYRSMENGILKVKIAGLITNNPDSGARKFAEDRDIPVEIINKKQYPEENGVTRKILQVLEEWEPNIIILAGYMKKLDGVIVEKYKNRILNIHPALLPSFGGKGMYGIHVHEAVLDYGVRYTGVTVHIVDFDYDTGPIILQTVVPVSNDDTPETLQKRVLQEEYKIYTEAIKLFVDNKVTVTGRKVIIREENAGN